ncbi:hypothetical protein bcgnr5372_41530 [Bacillus luti]|nr:hypothetical protein [Bacillus cereus]HDR8328878.1 hypothetical protein [Bacillus cereus]HDR8334312.1 hypothetical protein [Bacillus cereus]
MQGWFIMDGSRVDVWDCPEYGYGVVLLHDGGRMESRYGGRQLKDVNHIEELALFQTLSWAEETDFSDINIVTDQKVWVNNQGSEKFWGQFKSYVSEKGISLEKTRNIKFYYVEDEVPEILKPHIKTAYKTSHVLSRAYLEENFEIAQQTNNRPSVEICSLEQGFYNCRLVKQGIEKTIRISAKSVMRAALKAAIHTKKEIQLNAFDGWKWDAMGVLVSKRKDDKSLIGRALKSNVVFPNGEIYKDRQEAFEHIYASSSVEDRTVIIESDEEKIRVVTPNYEKIYLLEQQKDPNVLKSISLGIHKQYPYAHIKKRNL